MWEKTINKFGNTIMYIGSQHDNSKAINVSGKTMKEALRVSFETLKLRLKFPTDCNKF